MGGGTIIINHAEIKGAVGPGTDHFNRLPPWAQEKVSAICQKGIAEWTAEDVKLMHAAAFLGAAC